MSRLRSYLMAATLRPMRTGTSSSGPLIIPRRRCLSTEACRRAGTFGTPDAADPAELVVTTSHPAPYSRRVAVYVPKQYVPGTVAPFIVGADGPDPGLFTVLDNLIAERRLPVMIAISVGNGGGDAQGSERGLEYDTMSGRYAEFVEKEVLPLVEAKYHVKLTKDDSSGRMARSQSRGHFVVFWFWPVTARGAELSRGGCPRRDIQTFPFGPVRSRRWSHDYAR